MPSTGQFYSNEQLTSGDLQTAVTLLNNSFTSLITRTLYANAFTILNGLAPSASSTPDGGVQIASGLAYQNGQTVLVATQQGVNILPGSYPNGTGLAADATYNRIDVVYILYAQGQSNLQTRSFAPPNETPYTQSVYTEFVDGWTLSVVHGVASATPAVPSAPSGSVVLAQVLVPAAATTITSSDITDETATFRNDGGRLALATNGLLTYVSSAHLGTPAGMKLGIGATAYMQDNTTSGRLDIYGGTNGVSAYNPWYFRLSGTSLIVQPTTDAAAGTHMQSFRNASGTEYAWVDNGGNLSVEEGTFAGLATFNAGLTLPSGQTFTNAGTIVGGTISGSTLSGTFAGTPTYSGLPTFSAGLTGTGTTGSLTTAWANLTSVPSLVNTFNGRSGAVVPATGDYTAAQVTNAASTAAANTFSNGQTINAQLTVGGAGGPGIELLDTTSGQSTPNKYLRSSNGELQLLNSGYSAVILSLDDTGNVDATGTVTAASGQLGSASGTWTPASGTFNVVAGTVINVASVPSGAKMYFVEVTAGGNAQACGWGVSGSAGSAWGGSNTAGSAIGGYSSGISGAASGDTFGSAAALYDGSYDTFGYFQINAGLLQFVTTAAGAASTTAASTFTWGVS